MEVRVFVTEEMLGRASLLMLENFVPGRNEDDNNKVILDAVGRIAETMGLPSRLQIAAFAWVKVAHARMQNGDVA